MRPHVRIYLKAAGVSPGELIHCEVCQAPATDIHHIQRRGMGGSKTADVPENLMALCRSCHDRYGDKAIWKSRLYQIHNLVMNQWPKQKETA